MFSLNQMTFGLLQDTVAYAQNQKDKETLALSDLNLNEIIQVDFPDEQYYKEQTDKKQVVLHHTVSGLGVDGDISWWLQTADRIATAMIIDYKGGIYQCFSSKFWGHHIGVKADFLKARGYADYSTRNVALNKASIGIEIDAWGGLVRVNKVWYPAIWDATSKRNVANTKVKPITNVQVYDQGYRGYFGYEKYTDAQIEAVRKLLAYWNEKFGIPLDYNADMWDVTNNALDGKPGIWTHNSYRTDKSDCHPQPELIKMLQTLK